MAASSKHAVLFKSDEGTGPQSGPEELEEEACLPRGSEDVIAVSQRFVAGPVSLQLAAEALCSHPGQCC